MDNLISFILDYTYDIYLMLYQSALQMLDWYNTTVNALGFSPLEVIFGVGIVSFLGLTLAKWILDFVE